MASGHKRLRNALQRVRQRRRDGHREEARNGADGRTPPASERVASVRNGEKPLTRLFIRDHTGIVPVAVEQIVRLETDGDSTALIAGGRQHLVAIPLAAWHNRIRRADLVRVHRQRVVHVALVTRFVPCDAVRLQVEFAGGRRIIASRAGSRLLRGSVG